MLTAFQSALLETVAGTLRTVGEEERADEILSLCEALGNPQNVPLPPPRAAHAPERFGGYGADDASQLVYALTRRVKNAYDINAVPGLLAKDLAQLQVLADELSKRTGLIADAVTNDLGRGDWAAE